MSRTTFLAWALVLTALAGDAVAQGKASAPPSEAQSLRGTYSSRGGSSWFTPCGSKTRLKATDETPEGLLGSMYADVSRDDPAGQVFVQLTGVKSAQAVRIVGVERMSRVGPGCKEELGSVIWKGRGYEPGWWLEADALSLRFQPMSEASPVLFDYRPFTPDGASLVFESEASAGKIRVLLLPHRCHDEMTGGRYSWRMEVTFRDEKFTGCAYPGDARR